MTTCAFCVPRPDYCHKRISLELREVYGYYYALPGLTLTFMRRVRPEEGCTLLVGV